MNEHTIQGNVHSLDDLRDGNGEFLSGTVDVVGGVNLSVRRLQRLPVRFGAVGGNFYCSNNHLTSLEGAPHSVGGDFYCSGNWLTSLEGAPVAVGKDFRCIENSLTTLVGVHKILKRISGELIIGGNGIVTGGIGLILVEGLTRIGADQPALAIIINGFLRQGNKGLLRCQEALHDAGFGEFAKL